MLGTRLQVEWAIADQHRAANVDVGGWPVGQGLYQHWGDNWDYEAPIGKHPLVSMETDIANNIGTRLGESSDDNPVIALDFGGGLGLSWMRIAAQPANKQAIKEGRLAMVATNLGEMPDQSRDSDGYSGIARSMNRRNNLDPSRDSRASCLDEGLRWVQENQDLVRYLDANALELADMSIDLPNGHVPLVGNVAVVHEHYALAHTHVPDLALAIFSKLLNSTGTLYSDAATYYHLMHPELFSRISLRNGKTIQITEKYSEQRRLALAIGSKMLQNQGLSYRQDAARDVGIFNRSP
jgi:hypothetical protein